MRAPKHIIRSVPPTRGYSVWRRLERQGIENGDSSVHATLKHLFAGTGQLLPGLGHCVDSGSLVLRSGTSRKLATFIRVPEVVFDCLQGLPRV